MQRGLVKTGLGHIHYRTAGSGPAVMLFHINQQSSALMIELIEALAPRFRVVAMDYPSHGHSDSMAGQPDYNDYVGCAAHVLDSLGIEKASVMGEAVGAGVAVHFANTLHHRTERVVLLNCPFSPERGRTHTHVRELQSGLRPEDESGFPLTRTISFMETVDPGHAPMVPSQSWMDRINTARMEVGRNGWQAVTALANYDLDDGLRRLRQPTLILLGEHFHYAKFAHEMTQRAHDARAEILAGARFCISWERAAEIAEKAEPFLLGAGLASS
jgi:pimeloyl-ACP methyl ester carboxylesterase